MAIIARGRLKQKLSHAPDPRGFLMSSQVATDRFDGIRDRRLSKGLIKHYPVWRSEYRGVSA